MFKLLKTVIREWHGFLDGALVTFSGLLAVVGFSPSAIFMWGLIRMNQS